MCDLCTRNKKVFTHEHELFTPAELRNHEKFGDDNPGAIDQTGFKGHPECGFCRRRFYGDDELYTHCREKHERCHICDRRNQGGQPVYYLNYDSLEEHFRKDHYACMDKECLEKKFVVFESEMDLQAHQLEAHPNGVSRDARRVDMSSFAFRDRYVPGRRGADHQGRGREGRGRGRGRDPNAEPIPSSSAQPMSRDEIAFQRQMAIQTAQSITPRSFGGQLSTSSAPAGAPPTAAPANVEAAPSPRPPQDFPSLGPIANAIENTPQAFHEGTIPPAEQARRLRHNAVIERARTMLRNDAKKLDEFRARISSFRNANISAADLIEAFFALFDSSSAELGKLVKELADIFEIPSKKDELLKAWNDWKAINEDYPSLSAPSAGSTSAAIASHGGKRVLKLKSSTAQSSRSAVSRTGSWGSTNVTNLFPSLAASMASANRAGPGRVSSTPWAGPSASPASSLPASRSSSRRGGIPTPNADAFPALPAAAKPTSSVFSPGYTGSGVRRDNGLRGPVSNAWGTGTTSSSGNPASSSVDAAETGEQTSKKKGNKNKKQTLIHFG
jgi:E3 ubiquitin-protein ligase ZNF598